MDAPKLRVPEFSGSWKPAKAGEAFRNSRVKGREGLPIYSVTMDRGMVRRDSIGREIEADAADGANLRALPGDLAYNMMRMWQGAVGRAPEECMVSPAYVVLSPKPGVASDFFEHWFKSKRMLYLLRAYSQGLTSDRLRLYFDDFAKIPLRIPSDLEQSKIAALLSSASSKLVQLERRCELLKKYKGGVARKIFRQEIRFRSSDGRDYPEWDVVELGSLASKVKGKNKDGALTNVLTNSATKGVVSQSDYFDREIVNGDNLHGYYVVEKDDFVYNPRISVSAPVGPVKRNRAVRGVMSPLYTVFRFSDGNLTFLEQYFESWEWHDYMRSVANSGARHDRMNVTADDFFGLPIPLPSPEEQNRIADFLASLDAKIREAETVLENARRYRDGLLQQMYV